MAVGVDSENDVDDGGGDVTGADGGGAVDMARPDVASGVECGGGEDGDRDDGGGEMEEEDCMYGVDAGAVDGGSDEMGVAVDDM